MGLKKFFGFTLFIIVAWIGLVMVSDYVSTYVFRYRLTVEVNTPEGIKSGSSIVEATYFRQMVMEGVFGPRFPTYYEGEAVFVDLGGGRNIVLTLNSSPEYYAVRAFNFPWGRSDADADMKSAIERAKTAGPKPVPRERLGMMVTFLDINDPNTITEINNITLLPTFGYGYSIKAVTVEATDEPISDKLGNYLPWFRPLWVDPKTHNLALDGSFSSYRRDPFMIGLNYLKRDK